MTSRSLLAAAVLGTAGCATGSFGTLDSVLKGGRLASGAELAEVSIQRPGASPRTEPGMPVKKGDRIVTGPDVRAVVSIVGGHELLLEPSTDVEILNPSLFMRVGQAIVRTVQGVSEALKLKTTFVVAGVEGTQFEVKVDGGEFLLSVVEGRVTLESPTGAWPPATYGAMQRGRVRGDSPPERMPPLQDQEAQAIRDKFRQVDAVIRRRVPRLVGMSAAAARAALQEAGLAPGSVRERITGAKAGTVIAQEPAPGQVVRAGGRVDLVIEGQSVTVPALRGRSVREAAAVLERAGLRVGRVREELSVSEAEGTVLNQGRAPLARVEPGTAVNLTVAVAAAIVPDVRRLHQQQAAGRLRQAGVELGSASPVESAKDEPGTVLSQSPGAGTIVRRGSAVRVQVAAKPAPCVVPPLGGLTVAGARAALSKARLQLGRIQHSGDETSASDPVQRQSPQSGATVRCGSAVDVYVAGRIN
jgi:beta-lactam-binding protein with PASTA domain